MLRALPPAAWPFWLLVDPGVFLMEPDGLVRAATDMGRTLVQGDSALDMYDVLRRAVADHAVPAARAGASGRDVFLAATGALDAQREAIDRTGLGPRVGNFQEAYARYVGHTMDKQRHVSVHFTSTSSERLEAGYTDGLSTNAVLQQASEELPPGRGALERPWAPGASSSPAVSMSRLVRPWPPTGSDAALDNA